MKTIVGKNYASFGSIVKRAKNDAYVFINCTFQGGKYEEIIPATFINCGFLRVDFSGELIMWHNFITCRFASCDFSNAGIRNVDFMKCDFCDTCKMQKTKIRQCSFTRCDFNYTDMEDLNDMNSSFYCADLSGAKNAPVLVSTNILPSHGSIIGWKKVFNKDCQKAFIVKLEIPEDAHRCCATTRKCRCDKAKVLEITDRYGDCFHSITNYNFRETIYTVGEMVYSDSFDHNRYKECTNGIHFFITKDEAERYEL